MSDQPPQYVWHKLCAEKGEGRKFQVLGESLAHYHVLWAGRQERLMKDEYIPCPPPERWERVPIDRYLDITNSGETVSPKEGYGSITCLETQRFRIIHGALVLERRIS